MRSPRTALSFVQGPGEADIAGRDVKRYASCAAHRRSLQIRVLHHSGAPIYNVSTPPVFTFRSGRLLRVSSMAIDWNAPTVLAEQYGELSVVSSGSRTNSSDRLFHQDPTCRVRYLYLGAREQLRLRLDAGSPEANGKYEPCLR